MALTGTHISCGYVKSLDGATLFGSVVWGQTMATAGTTTRSAPTESEVAFGPGGSNLAFEIAPVADIFVVIGKTPDIASGGRVLIRAGETRNLFCLAGDKLAWATA